MGSFLLTSGKKADCTRRSSQAVPHPSTNRALCRLTSEVRRDPVHSTRYGRQRGVYARSVRMTPIGKMHGGPPRGHMGFLRPIVWSRVPVFLVTRAPVLVTRAPVLVTKSRNKRYILNNFRVGTLKLPLKFALKLRAAAQLQVAEANRPNGNH